MGVFDMLESKDQADIYSKISNEGSRNKAFTFKSLPESLSQMQGLPEAFLDTPFRLPHWLFAHFVYTQPTKASELRC